MKSSILIATVAAAAACVGTITLVTVTDAGARGSSDSAREAGQGEQELIERGNYLAKIAGCHDCHTPEYANNAGKVDESVWLTGDAIGWQGAWGTTYPANLRLYIDRMTEEEWLEISATFQTRPPMPWFNLHDMTEYDRKAIYRFVRSLGPAGEMAPAYVPPGGKATTPVVSFP